MASQEFSGRTALVTGGSRGIGRACVEMLARHGASVAVNFRTNVDAAQDVVRAVTSAGQRAIAVQADVSDETQVQAMVETMVSASHDIKRGRDLANGNNLRQKVVLSAFTHFPTAHFQITQICSRVDRI